MNKSDSSQRGFTIVELMIATTIFTFILLIAVAGFVRMGQLYSKGINQAKVQDNIRNVSDEITRSVQFADGRKITTANNSSDVQQFCIGDVRYTAYMNEPFDIESGINPATNQTGMWSERIAEGSSCCPDQACVDVSDQMLGNNVRVLNLEVVNLDTGVDDVWKVNVRLAYGDDDLLTNYDDSGNLIPANTTTATCKNGSSSSTFCATAQLDTAAKKRLN